MPTTDPLSEIKRLRRLIREVAHRDLSSSAYVAYLRQTKAEYPQFAHALADLLANNPGIYVAADKLADKLRSRVTALLQRKPIAPPTTAQPLPHTTPQQSNGHIEYDDSPVAVNREICNLIERVHEHGPAAFTEYMHTSVPCVPLQLLCLRTPEINKYTRQSLIDALIACIIN